MNDEMLKVKQSIMVFLHYQYVVPILLISFFYFHAIEPFSQRYIQFSMEQSKVNGLKERPNST